VVTEAAAVPVQRFADVQATLLSKLSVLPAGVGMS